MTNDFQVSYKFNIKIGSHRLTNRAQYILQELSSIAENVSDPMGAVKPVIDKLAAVKFKSDKDKQDWAARIEQKFGKDVADLARQYAGKDSPGSYPTQMTPALESLIKNINGIIAGNPG